MKVARRRAAFGRARKVAAIAEWEAGHDNLHVCWRGPSRRELWPLGEVLERNVRLHLQRTSRTVCLPQEIDLDHLKRMAITAPATSTEWRQILATRTKTSTGDG